MINLKEAAMLLEKFLKHLLRITVSIQIFHKNLP